MSRPQVARVITALYPTRGKIDQATIHKWEAGLSTVSPFVFKALAKVYGLPHAQFLWHPPEHEADLHESYQQYQRRIARKNNLARNPSERR